MFFGGLIAAFFNLPTFSLVVSAVVNQGGIPTNFTVGGNRHSQGGTPLNLPANSFIFSDTKDMKIKDELILAQFGYSGGVYTPADIAKKYDINKYRAILADTDSTDLQRKTAEMMISNYNLKLAKLALVQESKKGFPQGIPAIAMPYIESNEINPADFLTTQSQKDLSSSADNMKYGGGFPFAQAGMEIQPFMPSMTSYNVTPGSYIPPVVAPIVPTTQKVQISPQEYVKMMELERAKKDIMKSNAVPTKTLTDADINKLSVTELEALLNKKAYGGTPVYQDGGLTPEEKIKIAARIKALKQGKAKVSTPATHTTGTVKDPTEMDIYTPSTIDWIKQQTAAGKHVILPKAVPPGSRRLPVQHGVKDKANIYGKVRWTPEEQADFKARQPWIFEKRPNWSPNNDADVKWAQEEYNKINPGYFNQVDTTGKHIPGTGIDSDFGAHTFSMPGIQDKAPEVIAEETPAAPAAVAAAKKLAPVIGPVAQQPGNDPWWLQDIVKTAGATSDFFRVKKYSPWQATPGVTLPEPTFYDPTRELAANAELANIGTQGAGTFTNPQAYAAAFSQIQGQGAKNAADILGKYNNLNVGVANDFEIRRNDIMNHAAANRAGLSTQLADKYTILNQQFDNSKNMARQNLRQSYMDAITNKNYTGNLNDLYDQYKVDPLSGGRIKWTHGRPITPETPQDNEIAKKFTEAKKLLPGVSDDIIYKMITGEKVASNNPMYDPRMMGQ